jgi:hypothetical protein
MRFKMMWEHVYRNGMDKGEKFGVRRLGAAFGTAASPQAL